MSDGLARVMWMDDKSIHIDYDKGDSRRGDVVPGSIFDRIDFDEDARVWVPLANTALAAYDGDIASKARFEVFENRFVVDGGRGNVYEEFTYVGGLVVEGDYPDVRPNP
jgi:hypothetical protein